MKYPCLVDKRFCKTAIHVEMDQEEVDVYGHPLPSFIYDGNCNYQDKAKTILTVVLQIK